MPSRSSASFNRFRSMPDMVPCGNLQYSNCLGSLSLQSWDLTPPGSPAGWYDTLADLPAAA
eukprot:6195587-Heterocapsa_arctica.AAC.1